MQSSSEVKPRILLMGLRKYVLPSSPPVHIAPCLQANADRSLVRSFVVCVVIRSGKSSIVKVVFHKMSPNETLFLESTSKIQQSGTSPDREGRGMSAPLLGCLSGLQNDSSKRGMGELMVVWHGW